MMHSINIDTLLRCTMVKIKYLHYWNKTWNWEHLSIYHFTVMHEVITNSLVLTSLMNSKSCCFLLFSLMVKVACVLVAALLSSCGKIFLTSCPKTIKQCSGFCCAFFKAWRWSPADYLVNLGGSYLAYLVEVNVRKLRWHNRGKINNTISLKISTNVATM